MTFLRAFFRNRGAAIGLVILLLVGLMAATAPMVFPFSPWDMQGAPFAPPGEEGFWLGSDSLGRDVAADIAYGSYVSLLVGAVSTAAALAFGVVLGGLAGYAGGWVDDAIMRFTEFFQTVPSFILAVVLVAIFTPSITSIVVAIAIVSWPPVARVVRAEFMTLRTREFVQAAEVLGRSRFAIVFREILPNALSPIIVLASLMVASAILLESALSFLGLGDPEPDVLGLHDRRRPQRHPARLVDERVPRRGAVPDRPGAEPGRRRPERRAEPAFGAPAVSLLAIEGLTVALPRGADRPHAVKDVSLHPGSGRGAVHRRRKRLRQVGVGRSAHRAAAARPARHGGPHRVRGARTCAVPPPLPRCARCAAPASAPCSRNR